MHTSLREGCFNKIRNKQSLYAKIIKRDAPALASVTSDEYSVTQSAKFQAKYIRTNPIGFSARFSAALAAARYYNRFRFHNIFIILSFIITPSPAALPTGEVRTRAY